MLAMKDKQNNKRDMITSNTSDRLKIKEALPNYMDPLATDTCPRGLLNVVTGLRATDKVKADESIKIERQHYDRI